MAIFIDVCELERMFKQNGDFLPKRGVTFVESTALVKTKAYWVFVNTDRSVAVFTKHKSN